jgi:hypothetical protein
VPNKHWPPVAKGCGANTSTVVPKASCDLRAGPLSRGSTLPLTHPPALHQVPLPLAPLTPALPLATACSFRARVFSQVARTPSQGLPGIVVLKSPPSFQLYKTPGKQWIAGAWPRDREAGLNEKEDAKEQRLETKIGTRAVWEYT